MSVHRTALAALLVVLSVVPAHAGKGVRNRAGVLITPSITHRSLKAAESVPQAELIEVGRQLSGRVMFDAARGVDRLSADGIVFIDTSVPGAQPAQRVQPQRDAAVVRRVGEKVVLEHDGATAVPTLDEVATLPLAELPPPLSVEVAQAKLAASHPRVFARSGTTLYLVTNDLRPDDQIGEDGVLAWKLAWEVHLESVDLAQLLPDDPAGYRVLPLYAADAGAGDFGAPVAWVLPWSGTGVDPSRPGIAITWLWESIPGRKASAWFPYVRRLDPQSVAPPRR
ncbi:MAG: hypothetical protein ACI8PZ_001657 [Myxococcota bacterium]|jgi:hypothetical protein